MFSIIQSNLMNSNWQLPKVRIRIQLGELSSPSEVVSNIASIEGPVDVYLWYEGCRGLPVSGASFMQKSIFEPLYAQKKDAKLCLYSLRGWDFNKTVQTIPTSQLGERLNSINKTAIESFCCSSFFQFCASVSEGKLYSFVSKELPQKKWLYDLSENEPKKDKKVSRFFSNQSSLFDCIGDLDVNNAYSLMQYVEGYYLIREAVKTRLANGEKEIAIVFALPNDEGKYYKDLPSEIEEMLSADFGDELKGLEIYIAFQFFKYGESLEARPYIDKRRKAPYVKGAEVGQYFDYLPKGAFLKDKIHNINGWY